MYSYKMNPEVYGGGSRCLQSLDLKEVVRMHPDDLIALKSWIMAKRLYEREIATSV